jgi:hypothetical protein
VLAKQSHVFTPAVALQYGEPPVGSEPRGHRMWRGDRTPAGATITYRLASAGGTPRLFILNAAGDTVARPTATNNAGLNTVNWNLMIGGFGGGFGGGGFGQGGFTGAVNDPGFPAGFNPRPAEARGAPDSTGTPTAQARLLAGTGGGGRAGGGGGFGGGFGGARPTFAETGDYRVVLVVGNETSTATLRVVRVDPDEKAVLVPTKR